METSAIISDCGRYRYRLERRWADGPALTFVMLNPSTADASVDDPTIRRCIGFAKRENCGGLVVVNLYALRATDPDEMMKAHDRVGPENERWTMSAMLEAAAHRSPVVAAWGTRGNGVFFTGMAKSRGVKPMCLGTTKAGYPRHPLYVPADQPLVPFGWRPTP